MEFLIPCQTFYQLSTIAALNPADGKKPEARSIVFRRRRGWACAWATSEAVLSCYNLGKSQAPDETAIIKYDAVLAERCRVEGEEDAELKIMTLPNMSIISTTFGYIHHANLLDGNAEHVTELERIWQYAVPSELPTQHNGALFIDTSTLPLLGDSSPSGRFAFPEFIDINKPVIVRDVVDADWFGVFHPRQSKAASNIAAKLPAWLVK